jgi:hypothetical protein
VKVYSLIIGVTFAVACSQSVVAANAGGAVTDKTVVVAKPAEAASGSCLPDCSYPAADACETACGDGLGGCCECPRIIGRIGWLYMQRDRPRGKNIFLNPNGGVVLDASSFGFSPQSGIDAGLIYNIDCDRGVEVRYLWIDDFNSHARFDVPLGTNNINTTPQSFFNGLTGMTADFQYLSKLQTVEANVRRHFCRWDFLYGFRYVDFHESLGGVYRDGVLTETNTWGTDRNDMYGLQMGIDGVIWGSPCGPRLEGFGKAGIYYNDMTTDFRATYFRTTDVAYSNAAESGPAFLGEIGLTAAYPINCHWTARAGYQLMWLTGVAVAGDQVPATGNFNVPGRVASQVDADACVFLHGVNVGMEARW